MDHTTQALLAPAVGDHWKEGHDWNAWVVAVTPDSVKVIVHSGGHQPFSQARTHAQFRAWLTYGLQSSTTWAKCVARGEPVAHLLATEDRSPMRDCGCRTCIRGRGDTVLVLDTVPVPAEATRMILCPTCGNKRCPHATDHRQACTGSNEPGQAGSHYA